MQIFSPGLQLIYLFFFLVKMLWTAGILILVNVCVYIVHVFWSNSRWQILLLFFLDFSFHFSAHPPPTSLFPWLLGDPWISYFSIICSKDYFSPLIFFALLWKSINYICVGLLLSTLFCFIDIYICPYANSTLLWLLSLYSKYRNQVVSIL